VSAESALIARSNMDCSEANVAIQKAYYFAKTFISQQNINDQIPVEHYYDSWTGVVHSEIAIRSGDIELSRSKIGRLLHTYSLIPPPLQRLLVSNIEVHQYFLTRVTWIPTHQLTIFLF